jgi:hypothetical protein
MAWSFYLHTAKISAVCGGTTHAAGYSASQICTKDCLHLCSTQRAIGFVLLCVTITYTHFLNTYGDLKTTKLEKRRNISVGLSIKRLYGSDYATICCSV